MNIMFRGKNKRLPEPPSEYSLNSIKSIETDSAAGEGDDYDKRTNNVFKVFDSRTFGVNSKNRLILLIDPRASYIKKLLPDRFVRDEKEIGVGIDVDTACRCTSICIGEELTHIFPSHLKAVNPELEFVIEECEIEIKALLNFTFNKDIVIKNGSFHIFVYEGSLDIPNLLRGGKGERNGSKHDEDKRGMWTWKMFTQRCDWVYTIKGDTSIPHILYLNRIGNSFQLFHLRNSIFSSSNMCHRSVHWII